MDPNEHSLFRSQLDYCILMSQFGIVHKCVIWFKPFVFVADLGPLGAHPGPAQMNNQQGTCSMLTHYLYYLLFPLFQEVLESVFL